MGIFDKTPLPAHIDEPHEWKGTDDDQVWWMRWRLYVKHWFAFSFRSPRGISASFVFLPLLYVFPFTVWFTGWSWWYLFPLGVIPVARRWRRVPTVVLAIKGRGAWRMEVAGSAPADAPLTEPTILFFPRLETSAASLLAPLYLSRIQYWCRWHVALHWPLVITGHWYFKAQDVLPAGDRGDRDGKVFSFYRGWHFDADLVYWGDGAGAGNFK